MAHQVEQGALQAAMESLQAKSRQLHSQHQHWAWQVAALLHWKRQGAQQSHRLLHSWAMLAAASRSQLSPAFDRGFIRNTCADSHTRHLDDVLEVQRRSVTPILADEDTKQAGFKTGGSAENQMRALCSVPDGWEHHDQRMLGACFRGMYACRYDGRNSSPLILLGQMHHQY